MTKKIIFTSVCAMLSFGAFAETPDDMMANLTADQKFCIETHGCVAPENPEMTEAQDAYMSCMKNARISCSVDDPAPATEEVPVMDIPAPATEEIPVMDIPAPATEEIPVMDIPAPATEEIPVMDIPAPATEEIPVMDIPAPATEEIPVMDIPAPATEEIPVMDIPAPEAPQE